MPVEQKLAKAFLEEIHWKGDVAKTGNQNGEKRRVAVQFNPETLKVAFSNQIAGKDNKGGAAMQFANRGTTKLTLDLWFDVTAPAPNERNERDVRRLTKEIVLFLKTKKGCDKNAKYITPGTRFQWGSFLFEGVMESINENLEFFSNDGRPLRASVSVSLVKQEVEIRFANENDPCNKPQELTRIGDTAQDISARTGKPEDWQGMAAANNIETPRHIPAGTLVDPSLE